MVKVAITGSAGVVGAHLIKHLEENVGHLVTEIHAVDRQQKLPQIFPSFPQPIPIKYHSFDIAENQQELAKVFSGCSVAFHLANKKFDPLMEDDQVAAQYEKDNCKATENVLSAIIDSGVENLVYMGDAYANVPCRDNFGNSEDIHDGEPGNYMLGKYGESRTKAELYARSKVGTSLSNGKKLKGIFFRPVVIYGEGTYNFVEPFRKVAESNHGYLPNLQGPSNGLMQYVYAGTLAVLMEEAMQTLLQDPERINGEYFYCMDKTEATHFSELLTPFKLSLEKPSSTPGLYLRTAWGQFAHKYLGRKCEKPTLNLEAVRLYFLYAVGFSNRRQQLMFKSRPSESQAEYFERTVAWLNDKLNPCSEKCAREQPTNRPQG